MDLINDYVYSIYGTIVPCSSILKNFGLTFMAYLCLRNSVCCANSDPDLFIMGNASVLFVKSWFLDVYKTYLDIDHEVNTSDVIHYNIHSLHHCIASLILTS